jgi:hypothetical protein
VDPAPSSDILNHLSGLGPQLESRNNRVSNAISWTHDHGIVRRILAYPMMLPESLSRLTISTYISVRSDSRYALLSYTLSLSLNLNGTEFDLDPRSKRFNQRDRHPLIDLQQSPPTPCSIIKLPSSALNGHTQSHYCCCAPCLLSLVSHQYYV